MSKLKTKSEINIEAADQLIKISLYAPSVHCSYYSCFQLLKYTIKNFFGKDYVLQSEEINGKKVGSHQYVINFISRELLQLADIHTSQDFRRKYKDLQQFRLESDYENIDITSDQGLKAYKIAKEIRQYVQNKF